MGDLLIELVWLGMGNIVGRASRRFEKMAGLRMVGDKGVCPPSCLVATSRQLLKTLWKPLLPDNQIFLLYSAR